MMDLPQQAVAAETIVIEGQAITPDAGKEAFGALLLDRDMLQPASGRVEDALKAIGGVQLFRAGSTRSSNPTADGITARALSGNAASRLLVSLDGVPLADPFFGFVAWGNLTGRQFSGAELVRGGGLGGPGALAGTLALASAPPAKEGNHLMLRGGSRASAEGSASVALARGIGLFGGFSRGDGQMLVADPGPADVAARYRQWSAGGQARAEIGDLRLGASVSAFQDNRLRGVEGADIGSSGGDAHLRIGLDKGWQTEALVHAQLRDFSTVTQTLDAARTVATTALDQIKTPASGWGLRLETLPPLGDNMALRMGVEWREAKGQTIELFRYQAGQPTRLRRAGGSQQTGGLYFDASYRPSPALLLTAAARVDRWRLGAGELTELDLANGAPTLDDPSPARRGTEASGRMGALWRPFPAVRLRAAAYRGWRLPTLNELHRPFRAGSDATAANPALRPEHLDGIEASIAWQPVSAIDIGATVFENRLSDPISNVTMGQGPGNFPGVGFVAGRYRQRQNLEAIDSRGVEVDAMVSAAALRLRGSLALVDAKMIDGPAGGLNGKRPAQAPRFSGSLSLGHIGPAFEAWAILRHVGARFEDDQNDRRLAPATTLDARLAIPFGRQLQLELAGENLLDANIETGFSGMQKEVGQPRTLWIGLRWTGWG